MVAGRDLRNRWRSALAMALLVGLVGTVVFATAAGARRSASALDRFNAYSRSSSLEVDAGIPTAAQLDAFRRTPNVAAVAVINAYAIGVTGAPNIGIAATADNALGHVVDRSRLIRGRRANPNAPDEITIGEGLEAQLHAHIGSVLTAGSETPAQVAALESPHPSTSPPAGPHLRWRVVGIVRRPLDLGDRAANGGVVVLTPAWDRLYRSKVGLFTEVLRVRTTHGARDVPSVSAAATRIFGKSPVFSLVDATRESHGASDAINVLTIALWIFAAVSAVAGAVSIAIVLVRDIAPIGRDDATLHALGLTQRQRITRVLPRAATIAGLGAFLAVAGAVAVSPMFPLGIARRADVDVGVHADWIVLALGVLAIAGMIGVVSVVAAYRVTRLTTADAAARRRGLTPALVEAAAGAGLRPTMTNGLGMALQSGRGRTAVPVRSAFLGAAVGVLGIAAVLVFTTGVDHLASTPRLYGWTWDFKAPDDSFKGLNCAAPEDFGLRKITGVGDVAVLCYQPVTIGGRPLTGWALNPLRGGIGPAILDGRAPLANNEIALGEVTMHALHKKIGDDVTVQGLDQQPLTYHVVGRVVLPRVNNADIQPLADGAAFTAKGLDRVPNQNSFMRYLVGRFTPGADRAAVTRAVDRIPQFHVPTADQAFSSDSGLGVASPPPEVARVRHLNWFPPSLAVLLAVLAFIAVAHALITSVRRRGRDLAVLKTLGFDRGQVRATIGWQAITVAVVSLAVGIPAGVLAGRLAWRLVADVLGVSTAAPLPSLWLACTVPAVLAAVFAIAFVPASAAARTRPAVMLATE